MAVNLVSPGVKIREVDLTIGRIDQANDQVAGFAGPFQKGPVNLPILIQTERELLDVFGKPSTVGNQNTYWLAASDYLSYGGVLQIVRVGTTSADTMINAYAPVAGIGSTATIKINSVQDYNNKVSDPIKYPFIDDFIYSAKNPGTWGNSLKVYTIDSAADQIISGITTTSIQVGYGVSVGVTTQFAGSVGVETFTGYLKGIITGVGQSSIDVKLISRHSGTTSEYIEYSKDNTRSSIQETYTINVVNNSGASISTITSFTQKDWYDEQTVELGNSTVYWKNIAERPSTSNYVATKGGKNDEINVIVVDTTGLINNNPGEILERFSKLSKAVDAIVAPGQGIYYKDYIRDNSNYIFVGEAPDSVSSRFSTISGYSTYNGGAWNTKSTSNVFYDVVGNLSNQLDYGKDYSGSEENYQIALTDVIESYNLFENSTDYQINFLISGPSGSDNIFDAQAKANAIIKIAEARKDCVAVISPFQKEVVDVVNTTTQTNNIVKFFNGVTPSTYAVFDAGYKYTYDRFNNQFLYVSCNADVAGLMARTSINQYPWFSPAGANRGVLNNAIKLAYNPSEAQRDILYQNKINPIIVSTGQGIILYGDKTASANSSAFDRINVRRLFLAIERTIERAAKAQLFEFNDPITRSNFVNIVEPYLREVRAKRGITEYLLVCDETNNTPDIIDTNQFRADIYVKPARSINFIGLTFVATRTGISFNEIAGQV